MSSGASSSGANQQSSPPEIPHSPRSILKTEIPFSEQGSSHIRCSDDAKSHVLFFNEGAQGLAEETAIKMVKDSLPGNPLKNAITLDLYRLIEKHRAVADAVTKLVRHPLAFHDVSGVFTTLKFGRMHLDIYTDKTFYPIIKRMLEIPRYKEFCMDITIHRSDNNGLYVNAASVVPVSEGEIRDLRVKNIITYNIDSYKPGDVEGLVDAVLASFTNHHLHAILTTHIIYGVHLPRTIKTTTRRILLDYKAQ